MRAAIVRATFRPVRSAIRRLRCKAFRRGTRRRTCGWISASTSTAPCGPGSGGGCVFAAYPDKDSLFWNAPWQTGVAEPVAPKAARRDLTLSLVRGVLVMDAVGRDRIQNIGRTCLMSAGGG